MILDEYASEYLTGEDSFFSLKRQKQQKGGSKVIFTSFHTYVHYTMTCSIKKEELKHNRTSYLNKCAG